MNAQVIHPKLGQLVREGRTVYYATLAGGVYVEHSDAAEVLAYIHAEERAERQRVAAARKAYALAFASNRA